jgi:hypothetical protein
MERARGLMSEQCSKRLLESRGARGVFPQKEKKPTPGIREFLAKKQRSE